VRKAAEKFGVGQDGQGLKPEVLATIYCPTKEVAEKWRISPDVEFLRFFFGSLPRRMWAFY
jgi:hypothetical protein